MIHVMPWEDGGVVVLNVTFFPIHIQRKQWNESDVGWRSFKDYPLLIWEIEAVMNGGSNGC